MGKIVREQLSGMLRARQVVLAFVSGSPRPNADALQHMRERTAS